MIRTIIKIDEEKCNGCGLCAQACHEGAIEMVQGKAKLLRDDYCDGLGDCLPVCPTGAIAFEKRKALPFDEGAVKAKMAKEGKVYQGSCPGMAVKKFEKEASSLTQEKNSSPSSHLNQWPVQIKLVPVNAPYFENAHVLIAADCTAFAYGNFHQKFMKNHITLIGCPKLDEGDYAQKLTEILLLNNIQSLTVTRMEVPCCGGIENAVKTALKQSGKIIPWQVVTITTNGEILEK